MEEIILTPPTEETSENQTPIVENVEYLVKDNYLSEFESEIDKSLARDSIKAAGIEEVSELANSLAKIPLDINTAINNYDSKISDTYVSNEEFTDKLNDLIRSDGTVSFTKIQQGVTPSLDDSVPRALVTKQYVKNVLGNYLKLDAEDEILELVSDMLSKYALQNNTYTKKETYTLKEVESILKSYVKKDGTTPFTSAQSGIKPTIGSHLTTKSYVDGLMTSHKTEIDPHGYTEILTNKLKKYALKSNVLDKTQTYTRAQIDSLIDELVQLSVDLAMLNYLSLDDPHNIVSKIKKLGYVLKNGSIPFTAPLSGVDAINDYDLVTLHQVKDAIDLKEINWVTSGPVETTVGYVEDNSELPETMTFQEVMDAIFYGKTISIHTPEYVSIGNTGEIELCVHGSLGTFVLAELYLDGKILYTFSKEDFENGCITVNSDVIYLDSELSFKVIYMKDISIEDTAIIKCSSPIFVGILPKWKFGSNITMDYLVELSKEDPINNLFLEIGPDFTEIVFNYNFSDSELRQLFIVVPSASSDLESMVTKSQSFGVEAFDVIDLIPMKVADKDIIYKMYIYRLALARLDLSVTFNFKSI